MAPRVPKSEYYICPREEWDKEQCKKIAARVVKDGLGTPYPWPGYIGSTTATGGCAYGITRFNGGIQRGDKWYAGQIRELPKIAAGFEIVHIPTWGYRLKRKERKKHDNRD